MKTIVIAVTMLILTVSLAWAKEEVFTWGNDQVTINGDRGTIKLSSNGIFRWRPRYEIRQLTFLVAATLGLLR